MLKQMSRQKKPNFSGQIFCLVFFTFFVISDAENKVWGDLVINTSDTEELEEQLLAEELNWRNKVHTTRFFNIKIPIFFLPNGTH